MFEYLGYQDPPGTFKSGHVAPNNGYLGPKGE